MKNLRLLAKVILLVALLVSAAIFMPYSVAPTAHTLTDTNLEHTPTASEGCSPSQINSSYKTALNSIPGTPSNSPKVYPSEGVTVGSTSSFAWSAMITLANPQDVPKIHKFPEEGIPVLMYHSISMIPGNSLGVPVKQFKEEMEWLHRQNYYSLSLEEFYQILVNNSPVPDKPIVLTFDDGYADNYTDAWPTLRENGFKATFFIVTSSVGLGMMTWEQVNDLKNQGNSIGSHTVHHLDLATLALKQQESELATSKRELEKQLGISEQSLCFPSGRYNKTTLELMPQLGYRLGFTTNPGKVHLGDDLLTLKRMRISGGMSLTSFQTMFP